jgi:endo-1,4-beta-xylanase
MASWQCLRNRRSVLQLCLGTVASITHSTLVKAEHHQAQVQTISESARNFAGSKSDYSLRQSALNKKIMYGAAAGYALLSSDPAFSAQFVKECGILVPENDLKWRRLRPTADQFDFAAADWLIKFAQTHQLQIRGHTLVWHLSLPDWLRETINHQNAERLLVNHIETVVGRYAGKMHSWDVVNEAIEPSDEHPDGLRKSPWLDALGDDYIELAFRAAAAADPHALLTYNDYGLEYDTPEGDAKRDATLKLLERLKSNGTPIHAFGMQSHLDGGETRLNPVKLQAFLNDIAGLGLRIMITELDVKDVGLPAEVELRDRLVASSYEDYLNIMLNESAVIAVLTWGLSDRYTWLSRFARREDGLSVRPLPLDASFNRKPAWNAIARAFDAAPSR